MIRDIILEKIKAGTTVRVFERVKDGEKDRVSRFEGLVLGRKHGKEAGASFTVRATIGGVGVEKVYPINTPTIEKVEILSMPKKVRRSKIYFIRDISRKAITKKLSADLNASKELDAKLRKEKEAALRKAREEAEAKAKIEAEKKAKERAEAKAKKQAEQEALAKEKEATAEGPKDQPSEEKKEATV